MPHGGLLIMAWSSTHAMRCGSFARNDHPGWRCGSVAVQCFRATRRHQRVERRPS
jgi:hypothetical protein